MSTLPQTNMEAENGPVEHHVSLQPDVVLGFHVNLRGSSCVI